MDPSIAIALVIASKRRKRRRRRLWAKQWFLERGRKFGNQSLLVELRQNEPEDFKNFLRMNGNYFDELLAMVTPLIEKQKTIMRDPISPSERLSVTLRYLATGNSFEDLKFGSAVSPQAIGKIVIETCEALITCLRSYIKMPKTEDEWKVVADEFRRKWNFPHAIGAIDGKHVSIKKPPGSGSFYYNYKGFFSIVLMAVVNANYEFLMVDAGINGRVSDGGVISYSTFGRMMEQKKLCIPASEKLHENDKVCLPYVFLADDAFSLGENLMKPYSGEGAGKLDLGQCIYNYRVSRARRVVENAFGILVSRFGVFERAIKLAPDKAKSITLACCYLHNYLTNRSGSYVTSGTLDWEDDNGVVHQGLWRESQRNLEGLRATYGRNASAQAKYYRDLYKEYFNSKGAVPWQKEHCTWLN